MEKEPKRIKIRAIELFHKNSPFRHPRIVQSKKIYTRKGRQAKA